MIQYKLIAYALAALALIGVGYGWRAVNDAKKIGALELANDSFDKQQKIMQAEAAKTAGKIEEAEAIAGQIAKAKGDTIIRLNAAPIGPGCEGAMQFLRDEAMRAQTARKKFNETHPNP